ncbi:MAG: hypothetical protein WBM32_00740 [Crocosphaera sp.]
MKIANPLYYPLAVLVGGMVLVIGIRFLGLSNMVTLPTALAVTVVGATALKAREPDGEKRVKQQLEQELQVIQGSARSLAEKSEVLRQEANQLLSSSSVPIDLLVSVQQACDLTIELPQKIAQIAKDLPESESLLSINELQQQLLEVKSKIRSSSGVSRQQLAQLKASLEKNIELTKQGQDTRQAKLTSLYTVIQNSAGSLQQLQNKLRTADLTNSEELLDLRNLSQELSGFQENIELIFS